MRTDVVHGKNVGMVQGGNRLRLLLKATQTIGFGGKGFRENL